MLTRKHFQTAAAIVAELVKANRMNDAGTAFATFVVFFRAEASRFDLAKFQAACGLAALPREVANLERSDQAAE